ncbi:S41 family peptidase [Nonomuraea sp. NPDC050556]|uniref:S41 family peptidase n=1 Tax=Nonomuraea sp. NPDC050556 TaxID=3364369 RepID=UPI00379F9B5C
MKVRSLTAGLALLLAVACTAPTPPRSLPGRPAGAAPLCARPSGGLAPETATTIDVVEQAYFCVIDHYYSGATLDPRSLLTAGFVGLTRELGRAGRDVAEATMPALTGDKTADWTAFEATFRRIADKVPALKERLAAATLEALVAGLGDDHARWTHGGRRPPDSYDGDQYGLGLRTNIARGADPGSALPPLFVTDVLGGAAQRAGLRPGDLIESINGSAPFAGGTMFPAAVAALSPEYPEDSPVRLRVLRESTGRRWTVSLKPGVFTPDLAKLQRVTSKLVGGSVAYVKLTAFAPDAATRVLKAIATLRAGRTLTGVVLDLRGNTGGSAEEPTKLISGWVHGKVTAYLCSADGRCESARTDDTIALVGLPLAVLVDRGCASACEHFSSGVKDLKLGILVGTRTAGVISGPAAPYVLADNTMVSFPAKHHLGPNREVLDRIGVAPDHYVPLTARDAAAGRDPALAKALTLVGSS